MQLQNEAEQSNFDSFCANRLLVVMKHTDYISRNGLALRWSVHPTTAARTMVAHGFPGSKLNSKAGSCRRWRLAEVEQVELYMGDHGKEGYGYASH